MADFLQHLPTPRVPGDETGNVSYLTDADSDIGSFAIATTRTCSTIARTGPPPYLKRNGFVPRSEEDFGGGGAFPEIHVAQYPLAMGKRNLTAASASVTLQLGPDGKLAYDAVVKQGSDKHVVYTRPESAQGIPQNSGIARNSLPSEEEETKELGEIKQAIFRELEKKATAGAVQRAEKHDPQFVRYTPHKQAVDHNSGCAQRLLRIEDVVIDPLEPPRFQHKRAPATRFSPPPPVMHSPTRKLTQQDQQDWKIPPSVSNWKNQKGYTIPLDKRVAADGRNLQEISINDKFASLSEALYIAERQAREEIKLRNEIKKQKKMREEELREQQLRQLAAQARAERTQLFMQQQKEQQENQEQQHREQVAREREKNIEREVRLERAKGRMRDDSQRDISELVALGLPSASKKQRADAMFDTRLFNQDSGMDSGFQGGTDTAYNLYDKPLFAARTGAGMYQFSRDRLVNSVGEGEEMVSFAGADKTRYTRTAPVEFEKDVSDPFGLDNLLSEAKKK